MSPASVLDAQVVEDAPTIPEDISVEDTSVSYGDATEGTPDEGIQPIDTGLAEASGPPPADAHPPDVTAPPVDSGVDSTAPVVDAGAGQGPTCGALSSRIHCNGNQICCANLTAQTNACTSAGSCAANAT